MNIETDLWRILLGGGPGVSSVAVSLCPHVLVGRMRPGAKCWDGSELIETETPKEGDT